MLHFVNGLSGYTMKISHLKMEFEPTSETSFISDIKETTDSVQLNIRVMIFICLSLRNYNKINISKSLKLVHWSSCKL